MKISIGQKTIGKGHPVFIIAELSANHVQNKDTALATIRAMKESGADAVKIQTYTPDTITLDSDNEYFRINQGTIWDGKTLHQLYSEAYTPWEWHADLMKEAENLGLVFFSSPFDPSSVDFLDKMNVPAYKIASFEITDLPLIRYTASKGKPVLISTGIATETEIREAVTVCRKAGNRSIILLKCTSQYPAPLEEANLRTIPDMKTRFGTEIGISDHTNGSTAPILAVALGASVVEKHFILDRKLGGPDSAFSMDPAEFKTMVDSIRQAEAALGRVTYDLSDLVRASRSFSRSLFAVRDIPAGERLTRDNVRSIRPGYGLSPKFLDQVLKRKARIHIKKGTPIKWDLIR